MGFSEVRAYFKQIERDFRHERKRRRYEAIGDPERYSVGSELWLAATEKHFGGLVSNVKRSKFSEFEGGAKVEQEGGHNGGDRMFHQNYGQHYARYLERFVRRRTEELTVVEAGILKGSGLALWSKLFPRASLIGLDIDLSNCRNNLEFLREKGAFQERSLELYEFDQFQDNEIYLGQLLGSRKIDVFVDDGCHLNETILKTAKSALPHLADEFVYFVEDNSHVADELRDIFSGCDVNSHRGLTVISR